MHPLKNEVQFFFNTCDHNTFAHDHEQNVTTIFFFYMYKGPKMVNYIANVPCNINEK